MIAFLAGHAGDAASIARGFTSMTREVDGPFNLHRGHWRGNRAAVYIVTEGADMAYAAARLSARRGARALVPLTRVLAGDGARAGDVLPLGSVWDLAGLEPLLRVLPDSAAELPVDPQPLLPGTALWSVEEELPALGTLPFPAESPLLLRSLGELRGIHFLDLWCAGAVEGAREEEIPIRPHALVEASAGEGGIGRVPELRIAARRDEQLAATLGLTPVLPGGSAPLSP